ncbi:MAG: poly(beta-D-mannuronate) C5 epimerase, partial [Paracoccaceae bacterium]
QTNAIRIEHGSVGAVIAGNVILNGDRAGVVIRHNSHHSLVLRNIIWAREGGGILLSHSECSRVISNLVMDNGQKGIEVRSSKESLIEANIVVSNHSAGIWVSAQENGTQTFVTANILGANGTGIASATGATIVLEKNDFTAQFPQFLGGDLALQSRHIAQNIDGHEKVILTSAGRQQNTDLYPECPQYQASY